MKRLLNFRIFLFAALSLISGIALCGFSHYNGRAYIIVAASAASLAALLAVISLILGKKAPPILSKTTPFRLPALVLAAAFLVGAASFRISFSSLEARMPSPGYYTFSGVVEEVSAHGDGFRYVMSGVMLTEGGGEPQKMRGRVSVSIDGQTKPYLVSDFLEGRFWLQPSSASAYGSVNAYPVRTGIYARAYASAAYVDKTGEKHSLLRTARRYIYGLLSQNMSEETSSVAYALLLGDTSHISDDDYANYRSLGVSHIFSVSGLHISFLMLALHKFFGLVKMNRRAKPFVTAGAIFLYAWLCGFSPTVLRAGLMGAVLMLADGAGKKYDALNSLSLAALALLLYNPLYLYDAGFVMSFAAVLGMFLLGKKFEYALRFLPRFLRSAISVSLSAQVGILPALVAAFNSVPLLALLANLVIIPLVTAAFFLLFALCLVCVILRPLGVGLRIVQLLLESSGFSARMLSLIPVGNLELYSVFGAAALYFAALALFSDKLFIERGKRFAAASVSLVLSAALALSHFAPPAPRLSGVASLARCPGAHLLIGESTVLISGGEESSAAYAVRELRKNRVFELSEVVITNIAASYLELIHALNEGGYSFRITLPLFGEDASVNSGYLVSLGYEVSEYPSGERFSVSGAEMYYFGAEGDSPALYIRSSVGSALFAEYAGAQTESLIRREFTAIVDLLYSDSAELSRALFPAHTVSNEGQGISLYAFGDLIFRRKGDIIVKKRF